MKTIIRLIGLCVVLLCSLVSMAAYAQLCTAEKWITYKGVSVRKFPGSTAYFYVAERIAIDADGAPNAYHPNNTGIDALKNAGYPDGSWKSILVTDPQDSSRPFKQIEGEFAGYFVSMTTLKDKTRAVTDPARYVNAASVPYMVFPSTFWKIKGTGNFGDFAIAKSINNNITSSAIIADAAGDKPLGEVSIKLAENFSGQPVNPRSGTGAPSGKFVYVVFPGSSAAPAWPVSNQDISARAGAMLDLLGGWDRVLACVN